MIDVHNHILPGVDDGAQDMATALEMGRILCALGFDTIAASPHLGMGPGGDVCPKRAQEVRAELGEAFAAEGLDLKLLPNSEHHVTPELFERMHDNKIVGVGGASKWLLVELPWMPITNVADVLFRIRTKGFKLLLAHPERYKYLEVKDAEALVAQGVRLQLDLGSFVGLYGQRAEQKALEYMDLDLGHVLGTDLHQAEDAMAWISDAFKMIKSKWGEQVLEMGFLTNPRCLIADADPDTLLGMRRSM